MNTTDLLLSKLHPFEDHPYKVQDNEDMQALTDSIREQGILSPVIVRPLESGDYEIISGHRRCHAAHLAGLETVPALIMPMSRDEAIIAVVDSNLHREQLLPSEKAFAYKMKADALKHQGKRTDLTSEQIAPKLSTAQIGDEEKISKDTVKRYIRLTYLIPELLNMMDERKIAFSVGVELSYLDDQLQYDVLSFCEEMDCTPSYSQSWHLHQMFREGTLDKATICDVLSQEKPNQREVVKVPMARIKDKLPSRLTAQQQEDFIVKAVEHYQKFLKKKREQAR